MAIFIIWPGDAVASSATGRQKCYTPRCRSFSISPVSEEVRSRIEGKSYPAASTTSAGTSTTATAASSATNTAATATAASCPVPLEQLRYITFLHYGYDGKVHKGEMLCNALIARDLLDIFIQLFDARYQIRSARLIDDFDADDVKSMEAGNSSCFNYRRATGQKRLSAHARGLAVDINPLENPYVKGDKVEPETARRYADRTKSFRHKITRNDLCCKLFRKKGFKWGGEWRSVRDYQHFELQGSSAAAMKSE